MKKYVILTAGALALISVAAMADVLLPSQAVITGQDAGNLWSRIQQVTGQTPTTSTMPGHAGQYVNTNAQVSCLKQANGNTYCVVTILKGM